jgi:hypothetical protein
MIAKWVREVLNVARKREVISYIQVYIQTYRLLEVNIFFYLRYILSCITCILSFFFLLLDNEICLNKIKQYYCEFIIIVSPKTILRYKHVFTVNVSPWYRAMVNIMVFNATFNNISIILWRLFVLVEETGVPGENHRPAASHWLTYSHNVASSTPRTHNVSGDR